jgi:hypothetical protein
VTAGILRFGGCWRNEQAESQQARTVRISQKSEQEACSRTLVANKEASAASKVDNGAVKVVADSDCSVEVFAMDLCFLPISVPCRDHRDLSTPCSLDEHEGEKSMNWLFRMVSEHRKKTFGEVQDAGRATTNRFS